MIEIEQIACSSCGLEFPEPEMAYLFDAWFCRECADAPEECATCGGSGGGDGYWRCHDCRGQGSGPSPRQVAAEEP